MPSFGIRGALLLAAASVCAFVYLLPTANDGFGDRNGRGLLAAPPRVKNINEVHWDATNILGIVLSVLVSLTSSIDRECGVSLYMVLFSVMVDLPLRNAIAMTAFTVACGSLAPAIAAMSEPRVMEKGVKALVDYPATLILLPTMYWGISMGVIVNMWFPSWLLALLWVVIMAASNAELVYSFCKILRIRKDAIGLGNQISKLNAQIAAEAASSSKLSTAAAAAAAPVHNVGGVAAAAATAIAGADVKVPVSEAVKTRSQLLKQLQALRNRAEMVESIALLYPAFHLPSLDTMLKEHNINILDESAAAAPSDVNIMADQEAVMIELLQQHRYGTTRFTWKWRDWWALQNHFELSLVLKVVVLHLVTEAVRHRTTKPCTTRFWIMLFGVTGVVTAFLMFIVTSYGRRRLWRGPHWVDALQQVKQIKKQEKAAAAVAAAAADQQAESDQQWPAGPAAAAAGVAAGEAVAVDMAAAATDAADQQEGQAGTAKQRGCCGNCKKRLPWVWTSPPDAITNITACNSYNQYKNWTLPRLLSAAGITQGISIIACALGLPAGPTMAYLLLWMGIKPHVVAGSSRFLVLCFCFGVFVAYIIAGNLHRQLAAAYGLLNLGLAPLGMMIFRRLQLPTHVLLLLSLVMGVVGMAVIMVWQLVPLLADVAGSRQELPWHMGHHKGVLASVLGTGNTFDIMRFCMGHDY